MYIIRLLSNEGDSLLSAILHAEDGSYEEGAVDFWEGLRDRFGDSVALELDTA